MFHCPPTPAFAKAGAAPGTTAGVELFRAHSPLSLGHSRQLPPRPLAGSLCCSRVAACPLPAHPSRQLPPRGSCHQALWPSAFQHCSLPFACTEPSLVPQQAQHAPLPHAKATTRPQQWLKGTPRPQQWLLIRVQGSRFLYAFKAPVCQASNAPKPSKPSKSPASSARKRYPNKPNTSHSRTQKPPQGHSNGSRAPHGRSNGFLYAFKAAVCQASNAPKPSKTLQTLQKSGQLRREKVPQQAQHAPLPHAKATTRPQQWLKGTPRPQQWLLIRVQGCRFARPQTLQNSPKPSKPSKSPASSAGKRYPNKPNTRHCRTQKPPQGHSNGSRAPHGRSNGFLYAFKAAVCQASNAPKPSKTLQTLQKSGQTSPTRATPARKSHHKATAMAQEHPTAAAMASYTRSRLPFARPQTLQNPPKPSKPSKPSKSPASSAGKRYPNKPNTRHCRTQKPPQGHSNGSRAPHGRSNGFLYAFKAAVCQASNAPKPSKTLQTLQTLQKSGQLRTEKVPQQAQHAPLPHAKATTRPQQWLKGTPRPQQWLLIRVQGCRLPSLKRSKTLQTLQTSGQLRKEKVPQQAQHAPLPHAKATTRPQQWLKSTPRPQQWLLIRVQGCRLPGLKRSKTLQNPPNPPKVRPAPQGKGTPTSPTRATPARKSHHKATAMAEGHPTAAAMASYRMG